MKQHLNTLFVTTQGAYLRKDGQTVDVRIEKKSRLRVPLHNLEGIVAFGRVALSPALIGACADAGVSISFMNMYGQFLASVNGFTNGNVLLRREQYRVADNRERHLNMAKSIVSGKLANCRTVVQRAARGARIETISNRQSAFCPARGRGIDLDWFDIPDPGQDNLMVLALEPIEHRMNLLRQFSTW